MEMAGEILGQLLAACVGTAAFSALFGVPKKYWLDCGICGAVGWGVYLAVMAAYQTPIIGTFAASAVLTMLSRCLAIQRKAPDDPLSGMRHLPACAWSGDLLYRLQLLHGAGSAGAPVWHGYNQDGDRNRAGDRSGIFASGTSVWMEAGDRGVGTWERR